MSEDPRGAVTLPQIVIVDYDPAWAAEFERERSRIVDARPRADGDRCVAPRERLGYEFRGEDGIPSRYYFRKGSPRSHHIHLVEHGSDFWQRHLAFRDLLRERP